ncbi:MAG: RNA polymerase sigma factor [Planctomycetota bacterium]
MRLIVSQIPMRSPETRQSLIVRLTNRQNDLAWTEFVCVYEPFLTRLVRRQGTPERHVADVTQQLLIAIAKSVDGWAPDGRTASFRRWLSRVARNVVIKFMMRERKQITGEGGSDFLKALTEAVDPSIDAEWQRQYEQELIFWASERVRSEFRDASWRAFWETEIVGRSISDVATELGVSVGSIYMSRSRIFARIRTIIEEVMTEE